MQNESSDQEWGYAHWTFMTGTKPFDGIEMMLETMISNLDEITSHSNGSYSHTRRVIARNAISDTSIVMSYTLLEGFFSEEYAFYMDKKKPSKLSGAINSLLHQHQITLNDWKNRRKKIDMVRELRNAVAHNNGIIEKELDFEKYKLIFKEDIFSVNSRYPVLSSYCALSLIREFRDIAEEYAKKVFVQPNK